MKTYARSLTLIFVSLTAIIFFFACQKNVSGNSGSNLMIPAGKQNLSIILVDSPGLYQKVLVDIESIAVKVDTCLSNSDSCQFDPRDDDHHDYRDSRCEIWDTLSINPGIYDLLSLQNGVSALLANSFLIHGKIERLKITLGNTDSVMVDSVMHPLQLINGFNSVFVNLSRQDLDSLSSNNFQLYLDFNISRSIFYVLGEYWLLPVLIPFNTHTTGEIEGRVRPRFSYSTVVAYNSTDTTFAWPPDEGNFEIRGLQPGTYNVLISGRNGYQDSTINNITVQQNQATRLGTIQLHQ